MNEEKHIKQIKEATNELWAGYIHNFHCDFLHQTLTFDVKVYDNKKIYCYHVEIEGITEIAYYDDSIRFHGINSPFNKFHMEKVEFSSYDYVPFAMAASRLSFDDL
ncbi:MAG: hypothetical protein AAF380_03200, partial [Bacteroidota bacterium]